MALSIVHDLPGRIRLRGASREDAHVLSRGRGVRSRAGVLDVRHSAAGVSLLVLYDPSVLERADLLLALHEAFITEPVAGVEMPEDPPQTLTGLFLPLAIRPLMPMGLRQLLALKQAWPRLKKGLGSLIRGALDVDVLDAAAIGLCLLRRDFRTLTSISLLLGLGEFLEQWTRKRSEESLANSLGAQSVKAQLRRGEEEIVIDATALRVGDVVVVRQGQFIPRLVDRKSVV